MAPDVVDVAGWQPEVKYRKRLPLLVTAALAQATSYSILGQRPVAVLYEKGARRGIACLWLDDFARLLEASRKAPDPEASPAPLVAP